MCDLFPPNVQAIFPAGLALAPPYVGNVSVETVEYLRNLLRQAETGCATGVAIAVLREQGGYSLELKGDAREVGNQMSVAGMLACLQRMTLDLN